LARLYGHGIGVRKGKAGFEEERKRLQPTTTPGTDSGGRVKKGVIEKEGKGERRPGAPKRFKRSKTATAEKKPDKRKEGVIQKKN